MAALLCLLLQRRPRPRPRPRPSVPSIDMCRICLKKGYIPIFNNKEMKTLPEDIRKIGKIKVSEKDIFPKALCNDCISLLQGGLRFRQLAQQSQQILRRTGLKAEVNIESDNESTRSNTTLPEHFTAYAKPRTRRTNVRTKPIKLEEEDTFEITPTPEEEDFASEILECLKCNIQFLNIEAYEEHLKLKSHKYKRKECPICKKLFINLKPHMETHATDRSFICDICGKGFAGPRGLKWHRKARHTDDLPLRKCEVCPYSTRIRGLFTVHMRKHTGEKPYSCPQCTCRFRSTTARNLHVRRKHSDEQKTGPQKYNKNECEICKKTVVSIKNHMMIHSSEKPYLCDVCGKSFKVRKQCEVHRATHTNEFPYECKVCPYRARFADNLKNHIRTHTGEKPYACPHCPMRCSNRSNLNSHMRRHKTDFDHKCEQCGKGFHTVALLKKHKDVDHKGLMEHECPTCNKLFSSRKQMMKHTRKVHKREPIPKGHNSLYLKFVNSNRDGTEHAVS